MGTKEQKNKDFQQFVREFVSESDRAAVVLGAAKLDILLYQALERYLLPSTSSRDDLLDGDSGLGTFSARIQAAYRLGLIDGDLTRALNLIRKIRNSFAHETSAKSLDIGRHRDRIRELVVPMQSFEGFQNLVALGDFESVDGPSRDFRAALAVVAARLEGLVDQVIPASNLRAAPLISPLWKEPADSETAESAKQE